MNCPDKDIMQDFVDGELSEAKIKQIVEHIRSCDTCKTELRELLALFSVLNKGVDNDKCPALDKLQNYADDTCGQEDKQHIAEHVDCCDRCRSYVWALQASEQELADWQKQEEAEYRKFAAENSASILARATLEKLLPTKMELFDKAWQSVLDFVNNLKGKAIESWPAFNQETRLVGVLGFADASDPETDAASIIVATTLYVAQAVSDGDIEPSTKDIEAAVKEVAPKLGAGKELQKRLVEIIPPLVLESQLDADA